MLQTAMKSMHWMESVSYTHLDVYKRQALMGACADRNISLCYMTPQGKFLARVTGKVKGNVILREQQYASTKSEEQSLEIAKNCILGKVHNARWVLERAVRDHSFQIDVERVKAASAVSYTHLEMQLNIALQCMIRHLTRCMAPAC